MQTPKCFVRAFIYTSMSITSVSAKQRCVEQTYPNTWLKLHFFWQLKCELFSWISLRLLYCEKNHVWLGMTLCDKAQFALIVLLNGARCVSSTCTGLVANHGILTQVTSHKSFNDTPVESLKDRVFNHSILLAHTFVDHDCLKVLSLKQHCFKCVTVATVAQFKWMV